MRTTIEILAFLLNLIVWLGPSASLWRRRQFSLIDPRVFFSAYVIFTEAVAMSEHWFKWSHRGVEPGLRLETRLYGSSYSYFIKPLILTACVGLAFHIGAKFALRQRPLIDASYGRWNFPIVREHTVTPLFLPVTVLLFLIAYLPYLVLGQGQGYFWTAALIAAAGLLPLMAYVQRGRRGLILLLIALPVAGIFHSKGDYVYLLLPFLLYFQGRLLATPTRVRFHISIKRVLITACAITGLLSLTSSLINRLGEASYVHTNNVPLRVVEAVVQREYGFEVIAALVNQRPMTPDLPVHSWTAHELIQIVPSFLGIKKGVDPSHEVATQFMPYDEAYDPTAGYYRYFYFPAYYDAGLLGSLVAAAFFGCLFTWWYSSAIRASRRRRAMWPLMFYLPLPDFVELLVNGTFSFVSVNIIMSWILMSVLFAIVSLEGRKSDRSCPTSQNASTALGPRSRQRPYSYHLEEWNEG